MLLVPDPQQTMQVVKQQFEHRPVPPEVKMRAQKSGESKAMAMACQAQDTYLTRTLIMTAQRVAAKRDFLQVISSTMRRNVRAAARATDALISSLDFRHSRSCPSTTCTGKLHRMSIRTWNDGRNLNIGWFAFINAFPSSDIDVVKFT